MNATAKVFGPKDGGSYVARARMRWRNVPDWVLQLALAADLAPSQGDLAKRVGCSASAISGVIGNSYAGRMEIIEAKVRGALMSEKVTCPVLGLIARNECVDTQHLPFSGSSPQRARLWTQCPNCPNNLRTKGANNAQR
ncbi:MAG: hypothetical protein WCA78_00550 [Rhizomicrobium sp.]